MITLHRTTSVAVDSKSKGKVTAVPVLFFLTEHHAMQAYTVSGSIAPCILDLALDGGES